MLVLTFFKVKVAPVEAIFQLSIAIGFAVFLMLTVAISFLNIHSSEKNYLYLQTMSQDILNTLEHSNVLKNTIDDKTSRDLRILVNNLPANICGAIVLYDSLQSTVSVEKRECFANSDKINMYRSFIHNDKIYYLRVTLWYG